MEIKSRVPGKIVRFEKQVGDSVEVKDVLIVMEAMKMNNEEVYAHEVCFIECGGVFND